MEVERKQTRTCCKLLPSPVFVCHVTPLLDCAFFVQRSTIESNRFVQAEFSDDISDAWSVLRDLAIRRCNAASGPTSKLAARAAASSHDPTTRARAAKLEAADLLLANSVRYLQHSCANAAAVTSAQASDLVPDKRAQPSRTYETDVLSTVQELARRARQCYTLDEGHNKAMYLWWLVLVLTQAMPTPTASVETGDATADEGVYSGNMRVHALAARDLLLGLTQQRACPNWVRPWPPTIHTCTCWSVLATEHRQAGRWTLRMIDRTCLSAELSRRAPGHPLHDVTRACCRP